ERSKIWKEKGLAYLKLRRPERAQDLRESIKCFDEALRLRRLSSEPAERASLMQNRGLALAELATLREDVALSAGHLADAGQSLNSALSYFDKDSYPSEWASCMFTLAMIQVRSSGPKRAE